jgi:hypothetical protein
MAGKIFISYRRDDDPAAAARVRDGLARRFGQPSLFLDVDSLHAGLKFDEELAKALAASDVFIAIMGARWSDLLQARIASNDRDYVREEVAEALRRKIAVIPMRVGREGHLGQLPRAEALPPEIRDLPLYQKHDVTHENFARDIESLSDAIAQIRRSGSHASTVRKWPWLGIGAGIAALALVVTAASRFGGSPWWLRSSSPPTVGQVANTTGTAPQAQPCTFNGTWKDEYGTIATITQSGNSVSGDFTLGNSGGTLAFKGSVTGKDSVTEQKLRAIFPPTPTAKPMYQKGGAIEFTLTNGNCIRINGWMSNSMGQFQGEPGGILHTNISLRRDVIVPP